MKTFFPLLILLAVGGQALGQNYEPMAIEGAHWFMYTVNAVPEVEHHALTVRGDTMIDNQSYKKLYYQQLANGVPLEPPYLLEEEYLLAVIRDVPAERQVYGLVFQTYPHGFDCATGQEQLLWDFSAQVGDTVVPCMTPDTLPWTIDSVYTSFQYGADRKTFLNDSEAIAGELWEGIGSSGGPLGLPPYLSTTTGETQYYLTDYCVGTDADCGLISSLYGPSRPLPVNVFPNPATAWVQVSLPAGANLEQWQLIGLDGRIVRAGSVGEGRLQIDMTPLSSGGYFLWLTGPDHQIYRAHIVKP